MFGKRSKDCDLLTFLPCEKAKRSKKVTRNCADCWCDPGGHHDWSIEAHAHEACRLESKVTQIASKKCSVKEVTALRKLVRNRRNYTQLRPRCEISEAKLRMWEVGDDKVGYIGNATWELGGNADDCNMLDKSTWADTAEKQKELIDYFAGAVPSAAMWCSPIHDAATYQ